MASGMNLTVGADGMTSDVAPVAEVTSENEKATEKNLLPEELEENDLLDFSFGM